MVSENLFYTVLRLDKPPDQKLFTESNIKGFLKSNKSVLSHITFCLEDDDHKLVIFNR